MAIPISYNYRNLLARKLTTLMTLSGIALVVFVFAAVLMLAHGLEVTLISTGSEDNFVVVRKSATSDVLSMMGRDTVRLLETFPEIATEQGGVPSTSREVVSIINLLKYGSNDMGNVIVRGISLESLKLRPQVKLVQGRLFEPGKQEIIVGSNIAKRFQGCTVGERLKFGRRDWEIVGVFDAEKSGFESEIWGDSEQMMSAFNRQLYSTLLVRLKDKSDVSAFNTRLQSEPRLQQLETKNERKWYGEQSEQLGQFLRALGLTITVIFSFGAMIGAMITMYASVANRTTEIGTLRALGFRRRSILLAFLLESVLISLIGGLFGLALASTLQLFTISMLNFSSFSELAFGFVLSPTIAIWTIVFAVIMGVVGGFLPAVRASRLQIVNALRAS